MKGKCEHSPLSLSIICDAYAALKASKSIPDTIVLSPKQFALLQETLNDGPTPSMGYDFDYKPDVVGSDPALDPVRLVGGDPLQYITVIVTVDANKCMPTNAELALEEPEPLMNRSW